MLTIRQVEDRHSESNKDSIAQVQDIIRKQFPLLNPRDIQKIPDEIANPLKYRFKTLLFVAENFQKSVRGFALVKYAPDIRFCLLDLLATMPGKMGSGLGGVLYERVRDECFYLDVIGLFFECLPDDPRLCRDSRVLAQNAARLKFYEKYGARPIINTLYETPLSESDDCPPYLVFDDLGKKRLFSKDESQRIVRALLERKYGDLCPQPYIDKIVLSFQQNPVQLRPFKYLETPAPVAMATIPRDKRIKLYTNPQHDIHHIKQNGYVEAPVRIRAILKELDKSHLMVPMRSRSHPEKPIQAVHDLAFLNYVKKICLSLPEKKSIYPYVFPVRNQNRQPQELSVRAGYYCLDTFTPLNRNAYLAARTAVDCALTAAAELLKEGGLAYALVRPPGHHVERKLFGGFCYFNTAAIAANVLSQHGKVAIMDIDYHHGNGQQDIFYNRPDVLTLSIHGHPNVAYPYFSGFKDERGYGEGLGFNHNYPLPETITGETYRTVLAGALGKIRAFRPTFIVVAFGADTAKGDPTGSWALEGRDFFENGRMLGSLRRPMLIVQEGGYRIRTLGINTLSFFEGLWQGFYKP